MNANVRSASIAGAIAFVFYVVISMITGTGFGAAVGVGLIFLVGTALIVFVITTLISRSKGRTS